MLYLLRPVGEICLKSRPVRAKFMREMVRNIEAGLRTLEGEHAVDNQWSRVFVESTSDEAGDLLARIFGVSSLSPVACRCLPELEAIVTEGERALAERVRGKTFAIRARRSGGQPFQSQDVAVELGAALNRYAEVNLDHPDVTVEVEVREDHADMVCERIAGPGGLPLGVEGRAVALVSGGFDSAVAAWQILKRGVALDYVFCNLAGAAHERGALGVVKVLADLWSYGYRPLLHAVDFQPLVEALRRDVRPDYVQVILKRLMYRAASQIADELGAHGIVTGESIGQVSSQTLANLQAIDEVATLPVLRPLVSADKEDIIRQSQAIGTYALSAAVREYCALVPKRPVTAARVGAVRSQEARLDLALLDRLVAKRKLIDVASLADTDLVVPYLYTAEIPAGAVVIDCRDERHYDAWHFPGAVHHELDHLLAEYKRLDREQVYVIYCSFGLQSAVVAERLQRAGYDAYSFKGGAHALRQRAMAHAEEH